MFRKPTLMGMAALATLIVALGQAHVRVSPKEADAGAEQKYTMRVPNEKTIPTIRIEVIFPTGVAVSTVDEAPEWKLDVKKDPAGQKIVGAVWSGSSIAPRQVREFTFTARNPPEPVKLAWHVVQSYEDGTRSEWTGPEGSRTPASVTTIKAPTGTAASK